VFTEATGHLPEETKHVHEKESMHTFILHIVHVIRKKASDDETTMEYEQEKHLYIYYMQYCCSSTSKNITKTTGNLHLRHWIADITNPGVVNPRSTLRPTELVGLIR
jgi:hypothetical protein